MVTDGKMTVSTAAPSSSLTPLQSQTLTFLTSLGFRLSTDWFAYASQEIIREHNAAAAATPNAFTPETLGRVVYTQILFLPLHLVSLPALPRLPQRLSSYHNTTLNGTFILQVHRVKLVSVKQADRNEGDYSHHQRDHRQHRMSHLICGDGFTCVVAIELVKCAVIPDIEQPPPFVMTETTIKTITSAEEASAAALSASWVGYKIAVRDVEVRHGVLLLTPSNVQMLGGQLDSKSMLPAARAPSQAPTNSDQTEMHHADEIDQLYEYVTEDEDYTRNTSAISIPALAPLSAQYAPPQTVANRMTTRPASLPHVPATASTNISRIDVPKSSTPPIQRVPERIASRSSSNGISSSFSATPVSLVRPTAIVTAPSVIAAVDDDIDAFELNLSPPISSQRDDLYSPPPPLEEDDEMDVNQTNIEVNNNLNDNENINPTSTIPEIDNSALMQPTQSAQDFYNNYDNTLAARTSRANRYRSTIKNEQHLSTIVENRDEMASPQPQLSNAPSAIINNENTVRLPYGRNNPVPMPFTRASTLLTPQTEMSVAAAAAAPAAFKPEPNVPAPTSDAALQAFIEYSVAEQLSQPNISAEELENERAAQNEIDEIIIIDSDTDGEETDDPDIVVTSSVLSSQPSPSESQAAAQQEVAQIMSAFSPVLCRLAMLNDYRRGISDTTIVVTNGITIQLHSFNLTPLYHLLLWIDDGTQCILVCLHRAMVTHMFGCSETYHITHTTGAEERRLRVEKTLSAMSGVMSIMLVPPNKLTTKDQELYGDYPILLNVRPVDKDYLSLLQRTLSVTTK